MSPEIIPAGAPKISPAESGAASRTFTTAPSHSTPKLDAKADDKYTFDEVLLVGGRSVKVGNPLVEGASVDATVVAEGKAKKVTVYKYKPKKGYHKKNGHRQQYTEVKIDKINA